MRRIDWVTVTCLLLFAAGLRIVGMTYGQLKPEYFPSYVPKHMIHSQAPFQPDEYLSVAIPMEMALRGQLNPNFFEYPAFIVNTNLVLYNITGAVNGLSLADRQGENLRTFAPFELYVMSRMLSVVGGMLMVACAYAVSRIVAGRYVALSAGLLTAVSYTLVQHAHYIKPGTISGGWMMVATWASIASLYATRTRHRDFLYILAGVMTGLAGTTRYNAISIGLIVLLVGLILLYRYRNRHMRLVILTSWLAIPVVFLAGSPYTLLDFDNFVKGFTYIVGQFTTTGQNVADYYLVDSWVGLRYVLSYAVLFSLGIPAFIFAGLAFIPAWRCRPRAKFFAQNSQLLYMILIMTFVIAYALVVLRTIRPGHSDNLLILVLPHIALLSALGAGWLYQRMPLPKIISAPLITLILIVQPLILSVQVVEMFSQRDTRHIMLDWIFENVPEGSRFFLNGPYNVPLDPALYPSDQQFGTYIADLPDTSDYDYMIYSDALAYDIRRSIELVPPDIIARQDTYLAQLERQFTRVVQINRPVWTGAESMMNMAAYWHNPSLIIYCLNPASCEAVGQK